MKTSQATVEYIAEFEHLMLNLYNDANHNATIGYGHLVHMGPINGTEPAEFKNGIGKDRALELLAADVAWAEHGIERYVKVPLNQNQFDALVSFTYNLGVGTLYHSDLLKILNQGKYDEVTKHMILYDKSGGVRLGGLCKRRSWECALFNKAV